MRHNMKHSTQCFITRWKTSKIKNTVFSVFHLVMKHWASCFIYCLNFTKRLWRQPGQKFLFMFFFFLRSKPCMSVVSKAQSHHMTTTVIENKISQGRGLEFWKNPLAFATNIRKKQASDASVRNLANNQDNNCEIWSRTWSIPKTELCFVLLI